MLIRTAVILHNEIKSDSPEDVLDIGVQAERIAKILCELGYHPIKLPFTLNCPAELARLKKDGPFFAVNLVDAAPGEENLMFLAPLLLDTLKIPYTGCSAGALFLTTNKILTKRLLADDDLPTPEWITTDGGHFIPNQYYIIKAINEDASIGLDNDSVVWAATLGGLARAIAQRENREGKLFFAERYIDGREFTVCLYGTRTEPVVLPPYEWIFPGFEERGTPKIINYDAKWTENTFEYDHLQAVYHLPAEEGALLSELVRLAALCWNRFGLNGYARIDFRIDRSGAPWILEINANPSFNGFFNIARAYELDFSEIIRTIMEAI